MNALPNSLHRRTQIEWEADSQDDRTDVQSPVAFQEIGEAARASHKFGERTYLVFHKRDFRNTGLDWRTAFYGLGHWVQCEGLEHAFQTEADAEAAGIAWVATGRTDGRSTDALRHVVKQTRGEQS